MLFLINKKRSDQKKKLFSSAHKLLIVMQFWCKQKRIEEKSALSWTVIGQDCSLFCMIYILLYTFVLKQYQKLVIVQIIKFISYTIVHVCNYNALVADIQSVERPLIAAFQFSVNFTDGECIILKTRVDQRTKTNRANRQNIRSLLTITFFFFNYLLGPKGRPTYND